MPAILDHTGTPFKAKRAAQQNRTLRLRHDAAQTTTDNQRHWANADHLSANAASDPEVRKVLRSRARYEAQESNGYAKGISLTLANDTIGTGPKLNISTENKEGNRFIEQEFHRWSRSVNLAAKLRTMRMAKFVDGEAFAELTTNMGLATKVKLDLKLIETEQVSSGTVIDFKPNEIDGIKFDEYGNPITYLVLDEHPGETFTINQDTRPVTAEYMIHLFREDRAGQKRGISEIAPALPLFAKLRRFTIAVLSAAETAAEMAGIIYTDSNALDSDQIDDLDPLDAIDIEINSLLTLPRGWKMAQMKSEQPATTYEMFKREILNEIARCFNMPANIATLSSAKHNFSSGKLDHIIYRDSITIERDYVELVALDKILSLWIYEASLIPGYLPNEIQPQNYISHQWFWTASEGVEPVKQANAVAIKLGTGQTSLGSEYAKLGLDIDVELPKAAENLGVTVEEYQALLRQKLFGMSEIEDDDDDEETDEEKTKTEK
jgi:capsid protein